MAAIADSIPDLRFHEEWQLSSLQTINVAASIVSMASALAVLLILFAMRLYDRRLVDRVSLRLTAAVSLTDLISSCSLVVYSYTNSEGVGCQVVAFMVIWLSNQYLFLTVAIAFNLQWLFLQSRYYNPVFEKWYYGASFFLSVLLAVIPFSTQSLGFDQAQGVCWYTPSYTSMAQSWEIGTYIAPQILCCSYCAFVVCAVLIKLKITKHEQHSFANKGTISGSVVNHVVRRIIMYPMTPLLTQLGFIVSEIYLFTTMEASYTLNLWGVTTKALPGFFNLIAFLIDPAFASTFKQLKKDMIERYGDSDALSRTISQHSQMSQMSQMDARTYKTYADNGALDYVMPRTNTTVSLAPLSPRDKPNDSQVLRWVVRRFWSKEHLSSQQQHPPQAQELLTVSQHLHNRASDERRGQRQQEMSETTVRPSQESQYHNFNGPDSPSFLGSPTAYLIGETPYVDPISHSMASRERFPSDVSTMPCSPPPFTAVSVDDLDAVVPWRVLEADEDDADMAEIAIDGVPQQWHRKSSDASHCRQNVSNKSSNNDSSWLELNEPESPSVVSQWLTRRGDSFESVRERVARSSKSIRRWRRNQQQGSSGDQDRQDTAMPTTADQYPDRRSRALSGAFSEPALEVVPESTLEDTPIDDRADKGSREREYSQEDNPFIRAF